MKYELLGEWGRDTDWPIYGLAPSEQTSLRRITINRYGRDFGDLAWHICTGYSTDRETPLEIHTILRLVVVSAAGDQTSTSGLREAKGLVGASLGSIAELTDPTGGPWEATALPVDGTMRPAETLRTYRGIGYVVDLDSVSIGLVGFDPARDSIGRIYPERHEG